MCVIQWRAPSLERGVSRVGKFLSGDLLYNHDLCTCASPKIPSEITVRAREERGGGGSRSGVQGTNGLWC